MTLNLVAFQGEKGAFSEEAAYAFFGGEIDTRPQAGLEDVFRFVEEEKGSFGLVPIENSSEGSINRTYDLLLESELMVFGEVHTKISHCLIGFPGAETKKVKTVYSHPQALAQCRNFLDRSGLQLVSTYDTAGSVKMIRERNLKDSVAVASRSAAAIYGMKVLAEGIEDNPNNYTRFFVLSEEGHRPTGRDKTSLVFSVRHKAGTLHKALRPLAERNINLTKIESRPTRIEPWEYYFYLDFEGHETDSDVAGALRELEQASVFLKILGSYPRWGARQ
ncbi:MAG: prephenate dehydratase [Candidatus Geothermarchaeales archaeon]